MLDTSPEFLALVRKAQQAMAEKNWDSAESLWTEIISHAPDNVQARIQKGNSLIQMAEYGRAEALFKDITSKWSDSPAGYLGLATVQLKSNKLRSGLQFLFNTLDKFPENANARLLLCQLFMRFKQYDIAREFLREPGVFEVDSPAIDDMLRKLETDYDRLYDQDGLTSVHNHEFMDTESFRLAYERGMVAANNVDYNWHWRVHIGLWAARSASKLEGDFVECGVNMGFLSSAIMTYLDWNGMNKQFYLLDTFMGIDQNYVSENEVKQGILGKNQKKLEQGSYTDSFIKVRKNFEQWRNVQIVKGSVPDTLEEVKADQVAFLHLDMNATIPEQAALEYFWDKLVPGAIVLMDDYAYRGFIEQKKGMDKVANSKAHEIVSLPTGQGMLIKSH